MQKNKNDRKITCHICKKRKYHFVFVVLTFSKTLYLEYNFLYVYFLYKNSDVWPPRNIIRSQKKNELRFFLFVVFISCFAMNERGESIELQSYYQSKKISEKNKTQKTNYYFTIVTIVVRFVWVLFFPLLFCAWTGTKKNKQQGYLAPTMSSFHGVLRSSDCSIIDK